MDRCVDCGLLEVLPPASGISRLQLRYIDELLIRPGLHGLVYDRAHDFWEAINRSLQRPQCEERCETPQIPRLHAQGPYGCHVLFTVCNYLDKVGG